MARECEICGRIIRGAGRKYCSYCRNSAEVRNRGEEDYYPEDLDLYTKKKEFNWKPLFFLLFVGLVVASFFIFSNNGGNNLNVLGNSTNTTCQYKIQQDTGKTTSYLQDNEGNKYYNVTKVSNFYGQGYLDSPFCKTSFVIENLINKDVDFKIYYNILYYDHVGVLERMPQRLDLSLSSLEHRVISDSVGTWGYHNCNVDQNSINVIYQSNSKLKLGSDKIYEKVCKICNGKTCLNDGEKCSSNSVCGSGICNINGVCGAEKIVECSEGFQNCNNESCLEIGIKNDLFKKKGRRVFYYALSKTLLNPLPPKKRGGRGGMRAVKRTMRIACICAFSPIRPAPGKTRPWPKNGRACARCAVS